MGNNWLGWQVIRWLRQQNENIVGLIIHPPEKSKFGNEITKESGVDASYILDGSKFKEHGFVDVVRNLKPDIGLSILFGYIISREVIDIFPNGCVNLHPAFLPYNRGVYPNVWSIVEETPAGATLHYINEEIDAGNIIAQIEIPVEPVDTGVSLYRKLEIASLKLFQDNWGEIRSGSNLSVPQDLSKGTSHRIKDVVKIDHIELDKYYSGKEMIDILRALTFPPYNGAYFVVNGRRIYMQLQLKNEDQSDK